MHDKSDVYQRLINAKNKGKTCVLATIIAVKGSTAARIGDKAIVEDGIINGWIGGGCSQGVVKKVATQLLVKESKNTANAKIIRVCPRDEFIESVECYPSHCPSEGSVDILMEAIANDPEVILYGETPIAQSTAIYIENLSYRLNWHTKPNNITQQESQQKLSKSQARIAIIATQGQGDVAALLHSFSQEVDHILLICSEKKNIALLQQLKKQGISEIQIGKIIAHAGLDIGASTPPEIALATVAQAVLLIRTNTENIIEKSTAKLTVSSEPNLTNKTPVKSSCCGG